MREIIGLKEVAKIYGVTPQTIATWDRKGRLPSAFKTKGSNKRKGVRKYYLDEVLADFEGSKNSAVTNQNNEQ